VPVEIAEDQWKVYVEIAEGQWKAPVEIAEGQWKAPVEIAEGQRKVVGEGLLKAREEDLCQKPTGEVPRRAQVAIEIHLLEAIVQDGTDDAAQMKTCLKLSSIPVGEAQKKARKKAMLWEMMMMTCKVQLLFKSLRLAVFRQSYQVCQNLHQTYWDLMEVILCKIMSLNR